MWNFLHSFFRPVLAIFGQDRLSNDYDVARRRHSEIVLRHGELCSQFWATENPDQRKEIHQELSKVYQESRVAYAETQRLSNLILTGAPYNPGEEE